MACPFYYDPPLRDSLKVCGSGNRNRDAPSVTHMKLLCLSVSAYKECPEHKRKTSYRKKLSLTDGFLKRFLNYFVLKREKSS